MAITASNYRGLTPASFRFQRGKRGNGGGDDADRWVPPVGEGKRERGGTGSGAGGAGLWAASGVGPDRFPGALFYFYFSFALFPFLFSLFIQTLFKFDPNKVKPICKIF
jgi:hypothetical protein